MDFELVSESRTGSSSAEATLDSWLFGLGLGELTAQFVDQGFDYPLIKAQGLTEEDLVAIGVSKRGHVKKLLVAAAELKRTRNGFFLH